MGVEGNVDVYRYSDLVNLHFSIHGTKFEDDCYYRPIVTLDGEEYFLSYWSDYHSTLEMLYEEDKVKRVEYTLETAPILSCAEVWT